MNFCKRCANEIEFGERFCASCSDQIPEEFECAFCDEDCSKEEFGTFSNDNPAEPICQECLSDIKDDELREKYNEEGQADDFFSEEYFEGQL